MYDLFVKLWPAGATILTFLLYLLVRAGVSWVKNKRHKESLYLTTTVVMTRHYGVVIVRLDKVTKELTPVDDSMQSACDLPSVIQPEDLIGGGAQWSDIVARLELLSEDIKG